MAIDWNEIDKVYYASEGTYKVKVDKVEIKQVGSKGNYIIKFGFAEDDFKYPTADHWISKDKRNWRIKHMKDLMMVLGASEDQAKKACEISESKDDFEYAVQGYEKAFTTLAKKKPEVEIEVYPDGDYSRAEFTDRRVAMKRDNNPIAGAEEVDMSTGEYGEMPF